MSNYSRRVIEVRTERMATGGEAVARLDDGRVIFVGGSLPDETVAVEITEEKKRFARGVVAEVLSASPFRVEPSCSHARTGECGGCDWMYIDETSQRGFKLNIVTEQLQRLGGVEAPMLTSLEMPRGRRSTVRCIVTTGRAGYRRRRSDSAFVASSCDAAHPLLEELIVDGRFGDATEVTLRVGVATGECLVLTDGDVGSVRVPDGVIVASADEPGDASIQEVVAGHTWRISAGSFFQTSHEGAEALVAAVQRGLVSSTGELVDLYAGVGLIGGAAAPDRLACAVESNTSSVADARYNLDGDVQVVKSKVERWTAQPFDTVIADPARRGLAKDGAGVVDRTGATSLVLVSCDPASLGRDTALLIEQGWRYDQGEVIDMFPNTSRIEVVSTFSR